MAQERTETETAWFSIALVGLSVFTVTTTEMLPIGLLSTISTDLRSSAGVTGLSVSVYGLVAGLSAPFMVRLTRKINRRSLLLAILAVYGLGNLVSSFSPNLVIFLASRLVIGLIHGLLWSIVANIAIRQATESDRLKATALAFSGISTALVLGVPFGTLVGSRLGWRNAFLVLSVLALVNLVALRVFMRRLPPEEYQPTRGSILVHLKNRQLNSALICTAAVVIANYCAYTYVSPYLLDGTRITAGSLGIFLLFYGISGVAGNFLASPLEKLVGSKKKALVCLISISTVVYALLFIITGQAPLVAVLLAIWGGAYSAMPVILQTLVLESTDAALRESATALYVLVFNTCIAFGSLVGGILVDRFDVRAPLLAAFFVSCTAFIAVSLLRCRFARSL